MKDLRSLFVLWWSARAEKMEMKTKKMNAKDACDE